MSMYLVGWAVEYTYNCENVGLVRARDCTLIFTTDALIRIRYVVH